MFAKLKEWLRNRKNAREERLWPERQILVDLNENEMSASYPNGDKLVVELRALKKVMVLTNESGPWGADLWFSFSSDKSMCSFPQGATGEKNALEYLYALGGFDETNFIKAMGSTSNAEFICWEKTD